MADNKAAVHKSLYGQVLIGIIMGMVLGVFYPEAAVIFRPCSDAFIKLIKMLIAPIIFLTIVSGMAAMSNMREVGKVGSSALFYFLFTTTFALSLGLIAANTFHPGYGMNINPSSLDVRDAMHYVHGTNSADHTLSGFLLNIIPNSFFSPFMGGDILQVVLVAILFSIGMMIAGEKAKPVLNGIKLLAEVFFKIIHIVMHLAPLAAFSAIAFSIGRYGFASLVHLTGLLLLFYLTSMVFVFGVLGLVLRVYCKISIMKLLRYIRTELFIILGTSSSETVLPNLMEKLEFLGCKKKIVGLVLPIGYSFNLDGTAIYLTLAALFIAQATNIDLTLWQQLSLLAVMIISSKGAAGVSGSGFVVLASSLAAFEYIPVAGIVLILGIDRFMSDARGITNAIGNTVATILIATWHGCFDKEQALKVLEEGLSAPVQASEKPPLPVA